MEEGDLFDECCFIKKGTKEKISKRGYEKKGRALREETKQLFSEVKERLEKESRREVTEFYTKYLNEVDKLIKNQDQVKEKWLNRLELLKSKSQDGSNMLFCINIQRWLDMYLDMTSKTMELIIKDIGIFQFGNSEFEVFLMTVCHKLTMMIIWFETRYYKTISIGVDIIISRVGNNTDNDCVSVAYLDEENSSSVWTQLAGKGDGIADQGAVNNLRSRLIDLSDLRTYIDAERYQCEKYLPNFKLEDASSIFVSKEFISSIKYKLICYKKLSLVALQTDDIQLPHIYIDVAHREEIIQVTDMVDLLKYTAKRVILFPILQQKEASRRKCSVCFREREKHWKLCKWCLGVTYCGEKCWNEDSPRHKPVCKKTELHNIKIKQRKKFQAIDAVEEEELKKKVKKFFTFDCL